VHFGTVNTRILGWRPTSGPQWSSLWESSVTMAAQRDELPTAVLKCIGLTALMAGHPVYLHRTIGTVDPAPATLLRPRTHN